MINELDDVLQKFLVRELKEDYGDIAVVFEQPRREWVTNLRGPTLNVYLHDIRENNKLRARQPTVNVTREGNGATLLRQALRIDLYYMITAWSGEPGEEHNLLMRTLLALYRYGELPEDLVQELPNQEEAGVPFRIAQYDMHVNPRDIWSVLSNDMRPSIDLMVTVAVNPFKKIKRPLVREINTQYDQISQSETRDRDAYS